MFSNFGGHMLSTIFFVLIWSPWQYLSLIHFWLIILHCFSVKIKIFHCHCHCQCGFPQWIYWRVVQDKCWSEARVPTIPYAVQCILGRIITDAFDGHVGSVSMGSRQLTNLRISDDIDGLADSETELRRLVSRIASRNMGRDDHINWSDWLQPEGVTDNQAHPMSGGAVTAGVFDCSHKIGNAKTQSSYSLTPSPPTCPESKTYTFHTLYQLLSSHLTHHTHP